MSCLVSFLPVKFPYQILILAGAYVLGAFVAWTMFYVSTRALHTRVFTPREQYFVCLNVYVGFSVHNRAVAEVNEEPEPVLWL